NSLEHTPWRIPCSFSWQRSQNSLSFRSLPRCTHPEYGWSALRAFHAMLAMLAMQIRPSLFASGDRFGRLGHLRDAFPGVVLGRQKRQNLVGAHRIKIVGQMDLVVVLDQTPQIAAFFGRGRAAPG